MRDRPIPRGVQQVWIDMGTFKFSEDSEEVWCHAVAHIVNTVLSCR